MRWDEVRRGNADWDRCGALRWGKVGHSMADKARKEWARSGMMRSGRTGQG